MRTTLTSIPQVMVLEPQLFGDSRGFFFESFQQHEFNAVVGDEICFVQDNHSGSGKNVLRGLHYQVRQTQGKLVRVIAGSIYDVAVDVRRGSPTFGSHVGVELSSENRKMLWVPRGFAHGFLTLSNWNEVLYKATDYYAPQFERSIRWDDPAIGITWPLDDAEPRLSSKDANGIPLSAAETL
ncbi:MAG: dTDP-4-dehydrorhamnose 3,5-epimerase [Acidobacteriaceae bacterium]